MDLQQQRGCRELFHLARDQEVRETPRVVRCLLPELLVNGIALISMPARHAVAQRHNAKH